MFWFCVTKKTKKCFNFMQRRNISILCTCRIKKRAHPAGLRNHEIKTLPSPRWGGLGELSMTPSAMSIMIHGFLSHLGVGPIKRAASSAGPACAGGPWSIRTSWTPSVPDQLKGLLGKPPDASGQQSDNLLRVGSLRPPVVVPSSCVGLAFAKNQRKCTHVSLWFCLARSGGWP